MAITVKLYTKEFQPTYNNMMLVLDSTNKSESLFSYVADLYVDGVLVSNFNIYNNPQGFGEIDFHKKIEPFISYDILFDSNSTFNKISNSYSSYYLQLSESYLYKNIITSVSDSGGNTQLNFSNQHYYELGQKINIEGATNVDYNGVHRIINIPSSTSVVTNKTYTGSDTGTATTADNSATIVTASTISTGEKLAFNGAVKWSEIQHWDYNDYTPTGSTSKFLSSISNLETVKNDDLIWLNFRNNGAVKYLEVTTNNGTYWVENQYQTETGDTKFLSVGVGPANLKNTTSSVTVVAGSLPMFDDNTTDYSILLANIAGNPLTKRINFKIDSICFRFDNFKLLYLDSMGSWNVVNFELKSKKQNSLKRETYQKNTGSYNPATNTYGWNDYDRGETQLDVQVTEKYTITTNWVNDTTSKKVEELLSSPEVYHATNDGRLFAVNITTNDLQIKNKKNDKIYNYTIDFKYSNLNNIQRG